MSRLPLLLFITATMSASIGAQTLRDAKVAFSAGNWTVLRSSDPMKDTTRCTGIYKENYGVQLTANSLYIRVEGGLESVMLRFGDKPARGLRIAEDIEKKIRSIIVSGTDFTELASVERLRYQVSTLVRGIKTDDIELAGFGPALENIRSGCPASAAPEAEAGTTSPPLTGSLCSSLLVNRMKTQGLKNEQILAICQ